MPCALPPRLLRLRRYVPCLRGTSSASARCRRDSLSRGCSLAEWQSVHSRLWLGEGELDGECGTAVHPVTGGGNAPALGVDGGLGNGEAEAQATEAAGDRGVTLAERLENVRQ